MSRPLRHACSPAEFLDETWGLQGSCTPLAGDVDENWCVDTGAERFVLKIAEPGADLARLAAEARVQATLSDEGWPVPTPLEVPDGRGHGRYVAPATHSDGGGWARVSSWLDGQPWSQTADPGERFPRVLGRFLARLDRALDSLDEPDFSATHPWSLLAAAEKLGDSDAIADATRRGRVQSWLESFLSDVVPELQSRPVHLIHQDANDHNILLEDGAIRGLIDFGDAMLTARVVEPAIAAAYVSMRSQRPVEDARMLLGGYEEEWPLHADERRIFVACLRARLCQTAVTAAQRALERSDDYAVVHAAPAWNRLDRWDDDAWDELEAELDEA